MCYVTHLVVAEMSCGGRLWSDLDSDNVGSGGSGGEASGCEGCPFQDIAGARLLEGSELAPRAHIVKALTKQDLHTGQVSFHLSPTNAITNLQILIILTHLAV